MRPSDPSSPSVRSDVAQSVLLGDDSPASGEVAENWRQNFPEIIGRSDSMTHVLQTVSKVCGSDSAVLILGESGTGKELIASAIHRLSPRSHRPFIPINCSAIPDTLLESELFGHEKGAFTGADKKRVGHFEAATGGTIFLDEIGDMPASLQAKLLRVLQDKKFTPLGGNSTREADVRIIAATNKDLDLAVKRGQFRLDLYYRLNVLPITLPPLRERHGDIPALLEHYVDASNRIRNNDSPCFLTDALIARLSRYEWPGNVRQLQNLVERMVVLKGGGAIDVDNLPPDILNAGAEPSQDQVAAEDAREKEIKPLPSRAMSYPAQFGELPAAGLNLAKFIEDLENSYIKQALARTNNNKNQAARLLGLNRTTLVERIKKRKIQPLNPPSREL